MAQNSQSSAKKKRGRGRPFQPGQSGNPGGRPKAADDVRDLARQHTVAAVEKLVFWLASDNPKASVAAANSLLDRGWGRPVQAVSGPDGEALQFPSAITFVVKQAAGAENRT